MYAAQHYSYSTANSAVCLTLMKVQTATANLFGCIPLTVRICGDGAGGGGGGGGTPAVFFIPTKLAKQRGRRRGRPCCCVWQLPTTKLGWSGFSTLKIMVIHCCSTKKPICSAKVNIRDEGSNGGCSPHAQDVLYKQLVQAFCIVTDKKSHKIANALWALSLFC